MGGAAGRRRRGVLPALGLPALRAVPARADTRRCVCAAAGGADRAGVLGRADGRGDRAAAARGVARMCRSSTASRRSTATPRRGRGSGRRGRCASRSLFYAFLPLWALVLVRSRSLWPLVALFCASIAYKVLILRTFAGPVGPLEPALIALPAFLDWFALGHGRGAAGGARRALLEAVGVGARRRRRSTWRPCVAAVERAAGRVHAHGMAHSSPLVCGDRAVRARRRAWRARGRCAGGRWSGSARSPTASTSTTCSSSRCSRAGG